jgi:hypothetical protein
MSAAAITLYETLCAVVWVRPRLLRCGRKIFAGGDRLREQYAGVDVRQGRVLAGRDGHVEKLHVELGNFERLLSARDHHSTADHSTGRALRRIEHELELRSPAEHRVHQSHLSAPG